LVCIYWTILVSLEWNPLDYVYDLLMCFRIWFASYLIENFCVYIHQGNWSIIIFIVVFLFGLNIRVRLAS
jgi:hypothetical protein